MRKPATERVLGNGKELEVSSEHAPTIIKVRLTPSQERLLDTLRDPACQLLDVTKLCKLASITRQTYYDAFKNENFLKALEAELQTYRSMNEFQVMHNVVRQAVTGKNHHFAQMFLKMQGRLEERTSKPAVVQVNFNVQRPPKVVEVKKEDGTETIVDG